MLAKIISAVAGRAEALWIVAGFALTALLGGALAWLRRDAARDANRKHQLQKAKETADAHKRVSTEAATRDRSSDAVDQRLRDAGLL